MPRPRGRRGGQITLFDKAQMQGPRLSPTRLVFYWNKLTKTFDTNYYDTTYTDGRLSYQDLEGVLNQLKASEYWTQEDVPPPAPGLLACCILSFLLNCWVKSYLFSSYYLFIRLRYRRKM